MEFKEFKDLQTEHGEDILGKMLQHSENIDDRNTYRLIKIL